MNVEIQISADELKKKLNLKDGKPGKDGVGKAGPKGDKGDSVIGPAGKDGRDGKDGSPDTPDEVVEKVNNAEKKIEPKQIKGLQAALKAMDDYGNTQVGGGGPTYKFRHNGTVISDHVTELNFSTNLNPTYDGNGRITLTATDLDRSAEWGQITGTLSDQTDLQSALDAKVDENSAITGATKTKITYDAKGLVTAGADATTADIADSSNRRYVTDADLVDIGNLSGTNTGDQNSIVGITGTIAEFNAALSDGNFATGGGTATGANTVDVTVTDSAEIDFTLTGQDLTASLKASSIDESKLDASVNASLDLADSSLQDADIGTTVQAYSANLDEYAAVNPTAAGLALLDDADASAQRTTLGLGTAAVKNTGTSGNNVALLDGANTWSGAQNISAPSVPLIVNSTTSNGNKISIQDAGVLVGAFGGSATNPLIVSDSTGTQRFFFTNTGRMGVGLNASSTPTCGLDVRYNNLITTPALAASAGVLNATAATSGVPVQISPAFRWYGSGWDTDNSVSRQMEWYAYLVPVSGDTVASYLTFASSDSGGTITPRLSITNDGRLGLGTTSPNANAILDLTSTTKAFMPPRMTTTQRDNITGPTAGMMIYNTTTNKLNVYTTAWEAVTSA